MNYTKIIIIIAIMFFSSTLMYAQGDDEENINSLGTDLVTWLEKFDNVVELFFTKEEGRQIERKLSYLQNDLKAYLKIRRRLADKLNQNNYNVNDPAIKQSVSDLRRSLNQMTTRYEELSNYVDSKLDSAESSSFNKFQDQQQEQSKGYVGQLEKLINGEKVNVAKLKKDGEIIYDKLVESVGFISAIRTKLQVKFNL